MTKRDISAKQKRCIQALLIGASNVKAAQACGVNQNTITAWLREPRFVAALKQAESDAMATITRALVSIADKAAGTLEDVLDKAQARDSSKIRAADVVLGRLMQIKELSELEDRIKKLEEAQNARL